jgi:signal transduction histidine kinase
MVESQAGSSVPGPGTAPDVLWHLAMANRALASELAGRTGALGDDVLSNIGHELRTPLTIIQGLSEILLDELGDGTLEVAQHRDFLQQIHRASVSLGKLVESSITLTKLKAGQLTLNFQPLQLWEAIERVIGQYADEIEAKDLRVCLEVPGDLPLVWADGAYLELALQALLDNAIKFNHRAGEIRWRAHSDGSLVTAAIQDSGVGIPAEKIAALFEVFAQLDSGSTRRFGGLGLGLPLVRRLLEQVGGTIRAESDGADHGATFTFTLRQAIVLL